MVSFERICGALGIPTISSSQAAAAQLVDLLPPTAWRQWSPGKRTAARQELRDDAQCVLREMTLALDAGELDSFLDPSSSPPDLHWAELLVGRADRSQHETHGPGLHHFATTTLLTSIALKALQIHAAEHP